MCWSCNPICGGCRPPRKRPVKCPDCGAFNAVNLEHVAEANPCTKCGKDLTELAMPKPVVCSICREICYNPCRKGSNDEPAETVQPCNVRVAQPLAACQLAFQE